MILQVSPDASFLVRGAAALVLTLHIGGGGVGLLSGAASLIARKGGVLHRRAGNVFFVSMMIMSIIGAVVSPFLPTPNWGNVAAGFFTFYLVATSWMTVKRKAGSIGAFEIGAFFVALSIAVGGVMIGLLAAKSPTSSAAYVFAVIAALAALGDLKMIVRRGVSGAQRIARHLWRMCVALLVAAASLFLGQPQLFPASVHGTGLLFVPELAVLGALVFWLVRVRSTSRFVAPGQRL